MIIRWKHRWRNVAAAVLLCAELASCSQDDLPGNQQGGLLPDGEYPLMLTASVDEMKTRAAGKDAWTDGDAIGVRIGADGATGCYKLNADGTVKDAVTPVYWQNAAPADVKAWYPYAPQEDVDIWYQKNGFAAFDFLTAVAENQTFRNPVELKFKHRMAKVSYTLQKGGTITDAELASASVDFWGYTKVSFKDGELTGKTNGNIKLTSDGEALLVPQDMTGKLLIWVRITINGKTVNFDYKPPVGTSDGILEAGKHYHYTITVMPYSIEVTAMTAEWTDGGSVAVPLYKTDLSTAKVGDLLTASGKLIDVDDLDKISNATKKEQGVAVVFYVGQHEYDHYDYSSSGIKREKCHGYAVALKDVVPNKNNCEWGATGIICRPEDTTQQKELDWDGYKYTQQIINYAGGKDNLSTSIIGFPATYYAVVRYENLVPAPTNSSGWFLPSIGQMLEAYKQRGLLTRVVGSDLVTTYDRYWSSSAGVSDNDYFAYYVANNEVKAYYRHTTHAIVRSILAF